MTAARCQYGVGRRRGYSPRTAASPWPPRPSITSAFRTQRPAPDGAAWASGHRPGKLRPFRAGSAALLAITAILALAAGTILRHAAGAITAVIAVTVVTYFFSVPLAVLPASAADWLLRVTPANGYPVLSLADGTVVRAAAGTVLYLALIALLSLGIATAVRDAAVAIGVVLGLLYLFPILTQVVGSPGVARHLQQIGPMTAGLEIQASTGLAHLPIGPWAGLGVLAAWAAAALLAGALALCVRDA
jgi:hypothetical protein